MQLLIADTLCLILRQPIDSSTFGFCRHATVYLTSQFTNDVTHIVGVSDKILKNIIVGKNPNWIEFTPEGKFAIASNTSSDDASIIDMEKWQVIKTFPDGKNPKRLWVTNTK